MKIRIEVDGALSEDEVTIRCAQVDDTIRKIHQFILDEAQSGQRITFYKDNQEFFFPLETVLFFETEDERIFAHTANDAYRIKFRLYELEELLPKAFVRASKSTIVNISKVMSITRSLTASSLVQFVGSHKSIYVSRHYYPQLRQMLASPGNFAAGSTS